MTTCMESWIVADRETLKKHYGHKLRESALPATDNLEQRGRAEVRDKLVHATRDCTHRYRKGNRSFAVVAELNPATLESLLPSFARALRILAAKL